MRRFLASLALTGAAALLPVAGLVAVAPEAHATTQQCVTAAVQSGVPASVAEDACTIGSTGDVGMCVGLLSGFVPPNVAQLACVLAAGVGAQPGRQEAERFPAAV
ncbi:hypothetical protein [Kitasatospora griseola]|uniref:hypothetical protein n=1 Tax=Kitasatospora griseola TaxID=2064 RepID=UPI0037F3A592